MASDDAVTKIIDSLKETDELPRRQISEIVEVLGSEVALGLLEEVRRVQTEGGIAVRDGTRRRTDGGVFFSLAKGKLPKTDRNRIFRVRVAKPAEEGAGAGEAPAAREQPRPPAEERRPRQLEMPMTPKAPSPPTTSVATVASGGSGRRRVVEVEVLRHHAKPAAPPQAADNGVRPPPRAEEPAPPPPAREVRAPVRRIVVAAPVVKEEPPATPEAAREKVRAALTAISVPDQRRLLLDLLKQIGGVPELEPKREPKRAPEPPKPPPPPPPQKGLDDAGRERVLAAVTEALGLSTSDLARVLYGEETAGTRAKARGVLERFRKSR